MRNEIPQHVDMAGDPQSGKVNRRTALKLGLLGIETLVLKKAIDYLGGARYDPTFKVEFDGNQKELSFNECAQLARRFDKIYDSLPEYRPSMTQEDMQKWALEVIPMFEYEGFTGTARWPKAEQVGFMAFADGDSHNHVLGRSNCDSYAILSFRSANEHSSWFQDDDTTGAFIHELAHVQQAEACALPSEKVENTAQIMMLEVASALVNQGNLEVLPSLVSEIRGMALSSAYAAALKDKDVGKYIALRSQLSPGAISRAKFEKSARRWSTDPQRLKDILNFYNVQPLTMVINAIRFDGGIIKGLALPVSYKATEFGYLVYRGNQMAYSLNDLAYFLAHAEEIAKDSLVDWPPKK